MAMPGSWCEGKKSSLHTRMRADGFDISELELPRYSNGVGLVETICKEKGCSRLAFLYAKLGLHRYNLLQGKNFQLSSVKKYNKSTGSCAASTYYIILEAKDPAIDDSLQTFLTKVHEQKYGKFVLSCSLARPQGETIRSEKGEVSDLKPLTKPFFLTQAVPELPPENPFEGSKRYHLLKKSEVQENNDWIRLYLELAVATSNRHTTENHDLSNLKILKVAIDTTQDLDEALNPKFVAVVYIRYKDSCEARVGKDVDRIAIVRRFFNQRMGKLCLVGQNLISDIIIPKKGKKKKQSAQRATKNMKFKVCGFLMKKTAKAYLGKQIPYLVFKDAQRLATKDADGVDWIKKKHQKDIGKDDKALGIMDFFDISEPLTRAHFEDPDEAGAVVQGGILSGEGSGAGGESATEEDESEDEL